MSRHGRKRAIATACALFSAAAAHAQNPSTPSTVDKLIAEAHYLRARPLTQAELEHSPDNVRALIQQSVLDWAFFRFDAAIATAEKAVALAGHSAEAHTQLTNALGAKLVSSTAGTFEKMRLAHRFRDEAELALSLDPNSLDALEDAARFYWNAPGIVGGDKTKAQQLADRVWHLDPARGAALKAGFLDGKNQPAIEALWRSAVAASPNSADAHSGLAAVLYQEGASKYPQAESEARHSIALNGARIAPYRLLAQIYASTGQWDELDRTLKQSHAAVPDNLSPGFQAARIILTTNSNTQLARAEQYLRAYLAQPAEGEEPSHAVAHWRLGLVLEKQGKKQEAIHELQTAVSQDGSLEEAKKDLRRLS